jgi:hypothetical protein
MLGVKSSHRPSSLGVRSFRKVVGLGQKVLPLGIAAAHFATTGNPLASVGLGVGVSNLISPGHDYSRDVAYDPTGIRHQPRMKKSYLEKK